MTLYMTIEPVHLLPDVKCNNYIIIQNLVPETML